MISLKVENEFYEIGSVGFFKSFFETIYVRLENNMWGSIFPVLMQDLYQGKVSPYNLLELKKELIKARSQLSRLNPSFIVWDSDDLNVKPPWGDNISEEISDLGNYFVTSEGRDLFEILFLSIEKGQSQNKSLEIVNI